MAILILLFCNIFLACKTLHRYFVLGFVCYISFEKRIFLFSLLVKCCMAILTLFFATFVGGKKDFCILPACKILDDSLTSVHLCGEIFFRCLISCFLTDIKFRILSSKMHLKDLNFDL